MNADKHFVNELQSHVATVPQGVINSRVKSPGYTGQLSYSWHLYELLLKPEAHLTENSQTGKHLFFVSLLQRNTLFYVDRTAGLDAVHL